MRGALPQRTKARRDPRVRHGHRARRDDSGPGAPRGRGGFTLIEGLVASIILAMTAAGAAMALLSGLGAQRDAAKQLLASLAVEQQISMIMSAPYASVATFAGVEAVGGLLAPPRLNSALAEVRDPMGPAFADFGRTTTVTAETRTFPQYNNFAIPGWKIQVTVTDANGRIYASAIRFRGQEIGQ